MDDYARERYMDFLAVRRERILDRIEDACSRAGRTPEEVTLLAVSKTVGADEVDLAQRAGYTIFGENRPQELTRKMNALAAMPGVAQPRFDMIGNLQKNKINQVLGLAEIIHSVSSIHLAEAISKRAEARAMVARVLLEINVSGELSKSGFAPGELRAAVEGLCELPGISLEGVMTMAPAHDAGAARRTFAGLYTFADELRDRTGLELAVISCGMSDDFQIAIEEGSTLVRLGRTVFDPDYDLI